MNCNYSNYNVNLSGHSFQDVCHSRGPESGTTIVMPFLSSVAHVLEVQPLSMPINQPPQMKNLQPTNFDVNTSSTLHSNLNRNNVCGINVNDPPPFVQIHTTDVEPARYSYGNVFRQNSPNQEVIKSEPIKSENTEVNVKDGTNIAMQTIAQSNGSNLGSIHNIPLCTETSYVEQQKQPSTLPIRIDVDKSKTVPKVYKCVQCPFLSLSEEGVQKHTAAARHDDNQLCTNESQRKFACLGCDNFFRTHKSFYVHLCEDHRMCLDEAEKIVNAVVEERNFMERPPLSDSAKTANENVNIRKTNQPKIYLKNVECLREPRQDTLEDKLHETIDNNSYVPNDGVKGDYNTLSANNVSIDFSALSDANENPITSAISELKCVQDVLQESRIVARDYKVQEACSDFDFTARLEDENFLSFSNVLDKNQNLIYCSNANNSNCLKDDDLYSCEKRRRPKIYIKNVDILKEPLVLPSNLSNDGARDDRMDIPFITENIKRSTSNSSCNLERHPLAENLVEKFVYNVDNVAEAANVLDTCLQLTKSQRNNNNNNSNSNNNNTGNNVRLDDGKYRNEVTPASTLWTTNFTTVATETTPPPLSAFHTAEKSTLPPLINESKQKIFIKNVDIMKEPQFPEQRCMLHLRTVDELNLMNKSEVQNLIAPNLDISQNPSNEEYSNNPEETAACLEAAQNANFDLKVHDCENVLNDWANDYILDGDLNSIISANAEVLESESETMALQKQLNDLSTTQMPTISMYNSDEQPQITTTATTTTSTIAMLENNTDDVNNGDVALLNNASPDDRTVPSVGIMLQQKNVQENEFDVTTTTTTTTATIIANKIQSPVEEHNHEINSYYSLTPAKVIENSNCKLKSKHHHVKEAEENNISSSTKALTTSHLAISSALSQCKEKQIAPTEKNGIQVAENLTEEPIMGKSILKDVKKAATISLMGGTSNRGRPFGSYRASVTEMRRICGKNTTDLGYKCDVQGCAFRFKKSETLKYHKSCHTGKSMASQAMLCPECQLKNFSNWNTLHTHLWRSHKIDMELYSCELCQFKTPIYSRLINTHSKIHSEERNYKCDQCEKAFKNSKQLKNHRRWHRNSTSANTKKCTTEDIVQFYRCNSCNAAFSHRKTLREHVCKINMDMQKTIRCEICERIVSSKSSLKLHMLTHEAANRFKCAICEYKSNDHNAYRRHKMTHDENKMYICPCCDYKSIQSVAYQKHLQMKHPDSANNIILKCKVCKFSTINISLFAIHMVKHENDDCKRSTLNSDLSASALSVSHNVNKQNVNSTICGEKVVAVAVAANTTNSAAKVNPMRTKKIKVKSDLILADSEKFLSCSDVATI